MSITDQTVVVNPHGHQGFGGYIMRAYIPIHIQDPMYSQCPFRNDPTTGSSDSVVIAYCGT